MAKKLQFQKRNGSEVSGWKTASRDTFPEVSMIFMTDKIVDYITVNYKDGSGLKFREIED